LIQSNWARNARNSSDRKVRFSAAGGLKEFAFLSTFTDLGLSAPIMRALADEKYTTPTPLQSLAIPPALLGRDLLGCAQTGTGKTAAFALPILHRLAGAPIDKTRRGPATPRALILSPTRELAGQIADSFTAYGRHTVLTNTVIFGGVSQFHQVRALKHGIDILVATPGRLMDLMEQRLVNLSAVSIFVLDEADRMLDMGFIQPIRRIAAALPKPPAPRQTMLFSATMPREIVHLAESLLRDPVRVAVAQVASTAALIEQSIFMVPREKKQSLLEHLLREPGVERALVFTRTKHGADKVMKRLKFAGVTADAIHGNKAQNARTRALDGFRSGRSRVLVATDVAARGLDVDGITHVINFDLPDEPEAYVHRIGRTGRAGAKGIAVSFCDQDQRGCLRDIERLTGKQIPTAGPLPELKPAAMADMPRGPREFAPRSNHATTNRRSGGHSGSQGGSHSAPTGGSHASAHGSARGGPRRTWNQKTGSGAGRAGRAAFSGR